MASIISSSDIASSTAVLLALALAVGNLYGSVLLALAIAVGKVYSRLNKLLATCSRLNKLVLEPHTCTQIL
jgi:hypothetical protein